MLASHTVPPSHSLLASHTVPPSHSSHKFFLLTSLHSLPTAFFLAGHLRGFRPSYLRAQHHGQAAPHAARHQERRQGGKGRGGPEAATQVWGCPLAFLSQAREGTGRAERARALAFLSYLHGRLQCIEIYQAAVVRSIPGTSTERIMTVAGRGSSMRRLPHFPLRCEGACQFGATSCRAVTCW